MTINHIASIPVGIYINDNRTEHQDFYSLDYHDKDSSFSRTVSTAVLDNTHLKDWIEIQLKNYTVNALATHQKLKITQSWCLKHSNRKSRVYPHTHTNSIVSGAYYIKCDNNSSPLQIVSPSPLSRGQIDWDYASTLLQHQAWMWKNYEIFPEEGMLVLFPSSLEHKVPESIDTDDRCVLSFNTWFDGPIGNEEAMNLLS